MQKNKQTKNQKHAEATSHAILLDFNLFKRELIPTFVSFFFF